jgi:preprotein translocase subunit SecY
MAGVIPVIFASSILMFMSSIPAWFGDASDSGASSFMQKFAAALGPGTPGNFIVFGVLIITFCFIYTAMMYNPKEVADE